MHFKHFIILNFLLSFLSYRLSAQCDPGIMSDSKVFVCEDEFTNVSADETEITENCALGYVLLDNSAGELLDPVDFNSSGTFTQGSAEFDRTYYVFSVAGPDEDNDGLPELDNPLIQISIISTEVVFLGKPKITITQICDVSLGVSQFSFVVDGGFPGFDSGNLLWVVQQDTLSPDEFANTSFTNLRDDFIIELIQPEYFDDPKVCDIVLNYAIEPCLSELVKPQTGNFNCQ